MTEITQKSAAVKSLEDYVNEGLIQSYVLSEAYLPLYNLNNKPSKLRVEYRVLMHFHRNDINGQIEFTANSKKGAIELALSFSDHNFNGNE